MRRSNRVRGVLRYAATASIARCVEEHSEAVVSLTDGSSPAPEDGLQRFEVGESPGQEREDTMGNQRMRIRRIVAAAVIAAGSLAALTAGAGPAAAQECEDCTRGCPPTCFSGPWPW